jgi:hypothetical protein
MISQQERKERLLNTSHVIWLDDSSVHRAAYVEIIDNIIFVGTDGGLLFQDMDVLTLEEACHAEKIIINIKQELNII